MTTALNLATLNALSAQPAPSQAQAAPSAAGDGSGNPSFSQVLAEQSGGAAQNQAGGKAPQQAQQAGAASNAADGKDPKQAAAQDSDSKGSTQAKPVGKGGAKDEDKDASKDSDDAAASALINTAAAQILPAQQQQAQQSTAAAQQGTPATPNLPQQALDIAAQVAAVQTQVANRQSGTTSGTTDKTAATVTGTAGVRSPARATLQPASAPQAQQGATGTAALTEAAPQPAAQSAAAAQASAQPAAAAQAPAQNARRTAASAADPVASTSATKPAARAARDDTQASGDTATASASQSQAQQPPQIQTAAQPAAAPLPQHVASAGGIQAHIQLNSLAASPGTAGSTSAASAPSSQVPAVLSLTSAPVGSAQWNTDLGRQMVLLSSNAQSGSQTAELRLDPPNLGPLHITINLNDGVASAAFVSAHAAVRQALESAMPQLQTAFEMAGLSLGQTSVGDQGAQSGQEQAGSGSSSRFTPVGAVDDGGTATAMLQVSAPRNANALVDTFA